MNRAGLRRQIEDALGDRLLILAGFKSSEIAPLVELRQFDAAFVLTGDLSESGLTHTASYEHFAGRRFGAPWSIDDHLEDEAVKDFGRAHLRVMSRPSAVVTIIGSQFLTALQFATQDTCLALAPAFPLVQALEHKPWVESELRRLGVPTLNWRYYSSSDWPSPEILEAGPVMLRRSRSAGGFGFQMVSDAGDLAVACPRPADGLVSVSPFLPEAVPLNVGATVWRNSVTVHHPSIQLVGVPQCIDIPFGHCGNDLGAAQELPDSVIEAVEATTRTIGAWLASYGYRGTFGVDFLLHDGVPVFTEVNPRFQGSTMASCQLSMEADEPCLLLEHMAARLDIPAPEHSRPLIQRCREAGAIAHAFVRNTQGVPTSGRSRSLAAALLQVDPGAQAEVLAPDDMPVDPGGIIAIATTRQRLTTTGFDLVPAWAQALDDWRAQRQSPSTLLGDFS